MFGKYPRIDMCETVRALHGYKIEETMECQHTCSQDEKLSGSIGELGLSVSPILGHILNFEHLAYLRVA